MTDLTRDGLRARAREILATTHQVEACQIYDREIDDILPFLTALVEAARREQIDRRAVI